MKRFSEILEKISTPTSVSSELIVCLRELAALYRAGIPFSRALWIISQQVAHPKLQKVFSEVLRNINSGWTITNALSIYPGLFPELYVRLIEVGEVAGKLEHMLEKIAQHAEKSREKAMRLQSALAYPLFIIALCLGFLVIGPAFVFRGILEFLTSLDMSLPIATRILIGVSSFIRSPAFFISFPIFCVVMYIVIKRMWNFRPSRRFMQQVILTIPWVGDLYRTSEIATAARTMAVIFDSGIPLVPGLDLTRRIMSIVIFQEGIDLAKNRVIMGDSIYEALSKTRMFPPVLLQFVTAGEQSGDLGRMLNWAAWICEQNIDQSLNVVLEALQPIVILVIGVIVGFVIGATVAPMLKIAQGLM